MQKLITEKCNIFEGGRVYCSGYAASPVFNYNAKESLTYGRHSEYKSCFASSSEAALFISAENTPKSSSVKIVVADLKRGGIIGDFCTKRFFVLNNGYCRSASKKEFIFENERLKLKFFDNSDEVLIKCDFADFGGSGNLYIDLKLKMHSGDSLYQLAPFERNRKYFYYKQFSPRYSASGELKLGKIKYGFDNESAYVDVMSFSKPRPHSYQRLSACTKAGGRDFALCLASRVGDNRYANENCFFIDGELEKLSQINVRGTSGRLDRPTYFSAGYSAVDITFKPFTIKKEPFCSLLGSTTVVFGRLYGELKRVDLEKPIVLDNITAHMIFSEI